MYIYIYVCVCVIVCVWVCLKIGYSLFQWILFIFLISMAICAYPLFSDKPIHQIKLVNYMIFHF